MVPLTGCAEGNVTLRSPEASVFKARSLVPSEPATCTQCGDDGAPRIPAHPARASGWATARMLTLAADPEVKLLTRILILVAPPGTKIWNAPAVLLAESV